MPHVIVKLWPGKSERQKQDLADEITRAVMDTLHYGEELPLNTITRLLGLDNASGAKAYIVSAKRKLARLVQRRGIQGQYSGI